MIDWPAIIGIGIGVAIVFLCEYLGEILAKWHWNNIR